MSMHGVHVSMYGSHAMAHTHGFTFHPYGYVLHGAKHTVKVLDVQHPYRWVTHSTHWLGLVKDDVISGSRC